MYCPNCGAEISDKSKFCPACGKAVEQAAEAGPAAPAGPVPVSAEKKPRKKAKRKARAVTVLVIILLVIIAIPVGAFMWYIHSPVYDALKLCEKGDYVAGAELYNRDVFGSFPGELVASYVMPGCISAVTEDYMNDRIGFNEAYSGLSALASIYSKDLSIMAGEDLAQITSLNEAKTAMKNAASLAAAGQYAEAVAQYEQIGESNPLYDEVQASLAECLASYKEDVLSATASPSTEEEYLAGIDTVTAALNELAGDEDLAARRDALQTNYQALVKENAVNAANAALGVQDYEGAIETLEAALAVVPGDGDLTDMLNTARDTYESTQIQAIIDSARTDIDRNGEYVRAINALRDAARQFPSSEEIASQLQSAEAQYQEKTSAAAAEAAAAGDYASALKTLDAAIDVLSDPSGLDREYNTYSESYVKQIQTDVDALMADWNVEEAISEVKNGLAVLPNNSVLTARLDELNAAQPTSLDTLEKFNSDGWDWNNREPVDPFGNDYSAACNYIVISHDWNGSNSVEYRVYGQYATLTGMLAPYTDCRDEKSAYLQVYGDDKLLYTSPSVSRRTDAFTFSVDVSGAEYIKLVISFQDYSAMILSNVRIWP